MIAPFPEHGQKLPATSDKMKNAKTPKRKGNKLGTKSGGETAGAKAPSPRPEQQRHPVAGAVVASSSTLRKPAPNPTVDNKTSTSRSQAWNEMKRLPWLLRAEYIEYIDYS